MENNNNNEVANRLREMTEVLATLEEHNHTVYSNGYDSSYCLGMDTFFENGATTFSPENIPTNLIEVAASEKTYFKR